MVGIILLSLALATDAFAIGLVSGVKHNSPSQIFRLSFHFGFFQFLLSLIGATLLLFVESYVEAFDHWIAFILLTGIGARMVREGLVNSTETRVTMSDVTKGFSLIGLSLAVSIDALAAGITIPTMTHNILYATILIGVVASVATYIAMKLSNGIPKIIAKRSEVIGGIVLICIGVKIVLSHSNLFV